MDSRLATPGKSHSGLVCTPTVIDGLPETYLLLKRGRSSGFAKQRQQYAADGGPYELRIIAPGRDDLIAVSYKTFNPRPSLLPVLTQTGWYQEPNSVTTDGVAVRVGVLGEFTKRDTSIASRLTVRTPQQSARGNGGK